MSDSGYSMLIVEDENIVAMNLRARMERLGFRVLGTARSGEAAIAEVEARRPDLVLMDIRLDGQMDGIEAAEVLRERFDTPVILLTAYSDEATLERAKAVEPYGYILKPIANEELRVVSEVAVHRHQVQQQLMARAHQQAVLAEFGQLALGSRPLDDLLAEACRRCAGALDADCALMLTGTGRDMVARHSVGWDEVGVSAPEASMLWAPIPGDGVLCCHDLETEAPHGRADRLRRHGLRSALAVSVHDTDRRLGLLLVGDHRPGRFCNEDGDFLVSIANVLAHASQREALDTQRARYLEQLQEARRDLEQRVADRTSELTASEQRFRQLAESMPQIVWTARPDGEIDYFNRRLEDTGLAPDQGQGTGWQPVVHPDDREATVAAWRDAIARGEPHQIEHRIRDRAGGFRWMLTRAVPIRGSSGTVSAWYGTTTDIHEPKCLQQELRLAHQDLEQFAYIAAHDLQEPLRAVTMNVELLEDQLDLDDPDLARAFGFVRSGAMRMADLIRSVMLYATTAHDTSVPPAQCSARRSFEEAIELLRLRLPQTGCVICHDVADGMVAAPLPMLTQVWQHLVANAITYRSGRPLRILASGWHEDDTWSFAIEDNGIGITSRAAERIFDMFHRLRAAPDAPGIGMGLTLCRKIVERLGGRIWFEPRNQGSRFRFTLPAGPTRD